MKLNRMLILGAGGFGREIESFLPDLPGWNTEWEFKGYLDSRKDFAGMPSDYPILGNEDEFQFEPDDLLILAIASGRTKEKLYEKLKAKVRFFTYIHPSVRIGKFSEVGEGSIIQVDSLISCNVRIGKLVTINSRTQIGHDCRIGSYSSIMSNVNFGGDCEVDDFLFAGSCSTIIPQRRIGRNVMIGAGSVVVRDIKDDQSVFGNPAQKIVSIRR